MGDSKSTDAAKEDARATYLHRFLVQQERTKRWRDGVGCGVLLMLTMQVTTLVLLVLLLLR